MKTSKRVWFVIGGLGVLAIVAVLFTRMELQKRVQQYAGGQTVHFGGLEFVLPPFAPTISGAVWPVAKLGDLKIAVGAFGKAAELTLTDATIHVVPWRAGVMLLGQTATLMPPNSTTPLTLHDVALTFKHHDELSSLEIGSLSQAIAAEEPRKPGQFEVSGIVLRAAMGASFVPDHVTLQAKRITVQPPLKESGKSETFSWEAPQFVLESKAVGAQRAITISANWGMGTGEFAEGRLKIQPLRFTTQLNMTERSREDFQKLVAPLGEAFTDAKAGLPDLETNNRLVKTLMTAWLESGLAPRDLQYDWQGMTWTDANGRERLVVGTSQGTGSLHDDPAGVQFTTQLKLDTMQIGAPTVGRIELTDLQWSGKGTDRHATYLELLKDQQQVLAAMQQAPEAMNVPRTLLMVIAQYPHTAAQQFSIARITMEGEGTHGEYRDLKLQAQLGAQGGDGSFSGTIVEQTLNPPSPIEKISNAQFTLQGNTAVPWEQLQAQGIAVLQKGAAALGSEAVMAFFQPYRSQLALTLQGGSLGFDSTVQLHGALDLSDFTLTTEERALLDGADLKAQAEALTQIGHRIGTRAQQQGTAELSFGVDKLAGLKKVVDAISPNSFDLAMQQLGAWVVLDEAHDTLRCAVAYQGGKLLLNGKERPDLGEMLSMVLSGNMHD
ncbi:MAG: hypothetical protein HY696_12045 [Deltaproteobacteria bacterium]|nr:hypothetical protein [Deltaproteobacteria bacterium]